MKLSSYVLTCSVVLVSLASSALSGSIRGQQQAIDDGGVDTIMIERRDDEVVKTPTTCGTDTVTGVFKLNCKAKGSEDDDTALLSSIIENIHQLEDDILTTYNELASRGCDPMYRRLVSVHHDRRRMRTRTWKSFYMNFDGSCRGCSSKSYLLDVGVRRKLKNKKKEEEPRHEDITKKNATELVVSNDDEQVLLLEETGDEVHDNGVNDNACSCSEESMFAHKGPPSKDRFMKEFNKKLTKINNDMKCKLTEV